MGPVLRGLKKLQSVENQLRAAKAKLTRCRRNVIIQENQIRSLQNALKAKKEEIQLTRVQSDRLELELKSQEEEISKLRASLNKAKSNKEYAAILTQLNTKRADTSKVENQVLDLLKDIEADQTECEEIQKQIDQKKEDLEKIRESTKQQSQKYEQQIEEIQKKWDEMANNIPTEALEIFKRVAETYDGEALAKLEEPENKNQNYICGGCFMGVTAESMNLLMTRDEIIRCPNCTRILILDDKQESE